MHYLACHHWSRFQTKLATFWGVLAKKPTQKQPKMTVPAGCTKTFENLKLKNYRSDINETCSICVPT